MKTIFHKFIILLCLFFTVLNPVLVRADEIEELQEQIDELEKLKKMSEQATTPLVEEVKNLKSKIMNAQNGITVAKQEADEVALDIEEREEDLGVQYVILTKRIAESYKNRRTYSPLLIFFGDGEASEIKQNIAYFSRVQAQDNVLIQRIATDIAQLEEDKIELEQRQKRLASLQEQLTDQKQFFEQEIEGAKAYQQELKQKIAELTAKQKAIIAARSGKHTTSVGDVPLADDFNASIAFKSKAPSDSFAVFSFGGYTHRNGMSQYGAKARADKGQDAEEILEAYYPDSKLEKDYDVMSNITVNGVGTIPFEDQYLHGIYEMPGSWDKEALMAQAVAARTYAVRYTDNGQRSICTTEACQVFKNQRKGGDWSKAVEDTENWVLVDGDGKPVSTQYASTHGGYSNTSGWDTKDKSNSGDWTDEAWESIAHSPWFYKAWYRRGYFKSGDSCGNDHPWLSQEQMSDIINAWIVRKNPKDADVDRIQPVTINKCNIGGQGGDPYSMSELRDKADDAGGAVTNISDVETKHNNSGQSSSVIFDTNRGTITIPGDEFKTTFNLRAPGYIRIPQNSFAFFNIEHKK